MNATRRKALKVVVSQLEELDRLREEIKEQLSEILDEEQTALDNMRESLQQSERGQHMQECIDAMENAVSELDSINIEELVDQIREIYD